MKSYFAVRNNQVIEVVHLRGKLYVAKEKADTIIASNNKLYAKKTADELLISQSRLFEHPIAAERALYRDEQRRLYKQQKEDEATQKMLAQREVLIEELLLLCEQKGVEVTGIGFATNEQLEEEIYKLKFLDNE